MRMPAICQICGCHTFVKYAAATHLTNKRLPDFCQICSYQIFGSRLVTEVSSVSFKSKIARNYLFLDITSFQFLDISVKNQKTKEITKTYHLLGQRKLNRKTDFCKNRKPVSWNTTLKSGHCEVHYILHNTNTIFTLSELCEAEKNAEQRVFSFEGKWSEFKIALVSKHIVGKMLKRHIMEFSDNIFGKKYRLSNTFHSKISYRIRHFQNNIVLYPILFKKQVSNIVSDTFFSYRSVVCDISVNSRYRKIPISVDQCSVCNIASVSAFCQLAPILHTCLSVCHHVD